MNEKKHPIVMVSSSVYGQEELLDRIYVLLTSLGYEVWMSHKGTIPTNSNESTQTSCLKAVEQCDMFLGLITTNYGTTKANDKKSITHEEFIKAIHLNKPRWFLVHDRVVFARQILNKMGYETPEKRRVLGYDKLKPHLSDLRVIDMYEDAIQYKEKNRQSEVKWAQKFIDTDDATLFAMAQFSRYLDAEKLIDDHYRSLRNTQTKRGEK